MKLTSSPCSALTDHETGHLTQLCSWLANRGWKRAWSVTTVNGKDLTPNYKLFGSWTEKKHCSSSSGTFTMNPFTSLPILVRSKHFHNIYYKNCLPRQCLTDFPSISRETIAGTHTHTAAQRDCGKAGFILPLSLHCCAITAVTLMPLRPLTFTLQQHLRSCAHRHYTPWESYDSSDKSLPAPLCQDGHHPSWCLRGDVWWRGRGKWGTRGTTKD